MVFESYAPKQHYLDQGLKENEMGITSKRTQSISHRIQGRLKQYILKHFIDVEIRSAMGDILYSMAT